MVDICNGDVILGNTPSASVAGVVTVLNDERVAVVWTFSDMPNQETEATYSRLEIEEHLNAATLVLFETPNTRFVPMTDERDYLDLVGG